MADPANEAALEQGSYDLIKRRLSNSGTQLRSLADDLNQQRVDTFGSTELKVKGRARVRTEHNCIPRDIVLIGDKLIFAYNVFLGLKKNIHVSDVFTVQKLVEQDDHYEVEPYPSETKFLTNPRFLRDFEELYTYYKETRLQHLFQQAGKVFACFQIGEKLTDVRVFRWEIAADNTLEYIDNRGERDLQDKQDYDFEWVKTDRADHVEGRFGHINVLDKIFVETTGGDLTIKVENNTDSGEGIYSEPVEDKNQSLADCELEYAQVGELILLKVQPYREKDWRFFIFNCRTEAVIRQDAIGDACIQLPDDHGIIFPGGYYLQSGQTRYFDDQIEKLEFHRQVKSPNGEDVLYVFYEPNEGRYALFAYNLIEKNLQNPIYCHGYGVYDDGLTLTFKADKEEAERVHPIQIWQSPFCSVEFAANAPAPTSILGKIGNPDLVRGISDLYSVCKAISEQNPNINHYEALIAQARSVLDRYHWLADFEALTALIHEIFETSEQVLDEFEKVKQIQETALKSLADIKQTVVDTLRDIRPDSFKLTSEFVAGLDALKLLKGKIISLEEVKYIDLAGLKTELKTVDEKTALLSQATAQFLQQDKALAPYNNKLDELTAASEKSEAVTELNGFLAQLDTLSEELDLLNHTMLDLDIEDSRVRTQILEDVSGVYGLVNRAKASIEIRRKSLGSVEAKAEFSARFKLFSQSITSSLNNAKTPEQCDEQLSRLLIQLEELESHFSEYDEYLAEIMAKRDDVYESFEAHKQQLMEERQRRALNIANAAERILQGVTRRSQSFTELEQINSYFASDPMISKLRGLTQELQEIGDEIKADDILSKLKSCKDQGIRALRDKQDIYVQGGNLVNIGKHGFSVNKQALDLTLLPRDDTLMLHLTGTEYFEPIPDQATRSQLETGKAYWEQNLVSENADVYRGEYLAAQVLACANKGEQGLNFDVLNEAVQKDELLTLVQKFAEPRYQEGYEKGIHDHDACAILTNLLVQKRALDLLIYPVGSRIVAQLYAVQLSKQAFTVLQQSAKQAHLMQTMFNDAAFYNAQIQQLADDIKAYSEQIADICTVFNDFSLQLSAQYLLDELAKKHTEAKFIVSGKVKNLAEQFQSSAKSKGFWGELQNALKAASNVSDKAKLLFSWLVAYSQNSQTQSNDQISTFNINIALEAATMVLLSNDKLAGFYAHDANVSEQVTGLMGQHRTIQDQTLQLDYAAFFARTNAYIEQHVTGFSAFQSLKSDILATQKARLQLDEFKPKPLSSFVRNQLINKVYFPIIGDNLAKQIGASGGNKRTDLMGMLLLISPPGYGKTTLIEYVANRLGLTFVKVNCPSIGHDQVSLDPSQAINATAAKEIEKINQSFEMGNNVMLYLDDIQHTNPEFLQKFISLCDGSRRIDGVWNGRSKTYDLRGKKFAVVMAGNPYTESGESFKIPDMLANRADIYNLGDTLSGCEQEFAMSFVENALTSNAVLAPLANRNMEDLYKLVRIAEGEDISLNELEYGYSQAQANEIVSVLQKLLTIRDTVLKVNAQYIASAAQDNDYRVEPPFKLQGSYRNMNKMAEKVVAAMNDDELENLIRDHYRGEAQTLSKGSEENLLKLGTIRRTLTAEEQSRWAQICGDYERLNRANDAGSPALLAVEELARLNNAMTAIAGNLNKDTLSFDYSEALAQLIGAQQNQQGAEAINEGLNGINQTLQSQVAQSQQSGELTANKLVDIAQAFNVIANKLNKTQLSHNYTDVFQALLANTEGKPKASDLQALQDALVNSQAQSSSQLNKALTQGVTSLTQGIQDLKAHNAASASAEFDIELNTQFDALKHRLSQAEAALQANSKQLNQQAEQQAQQSEQQHSAVLSQLVERLEGLHTQFDTAQSQQQSSEGQSLTALTELLQVTLPSFVQHLDKHQALEPAISSKLDGILAKLTQLEHLPSKEEGSSSNNPYML